MQFNPSAPRANHPLQLLPELPFLIACCRAEPTGDDIDLILAYLSHTTDVQIPITAALQHGVIPLVYQSLKQLSENNLLGTENELLTSSKDAYIQIAHRNMLMSAELLRIIKLLEDNGIKALAFKGPALARQAYGDITLRQFGDLDILIQKEHALKTVALIEREGYAPEIILSGRKKEAFYASVNVIGLEKVSHGLRIEVHWGLLSKNYALTWDQDTLRSHAHHVVINGKEVPLLSPEHHLLYLCVHGSKHLYERLEWINDIDRIVRATPELDWRQLFSEAENMGIVRMVFLSLWLCRELLALHLPADINTKVDGDKTACALGQHIVGMLSGKTPHGKTYGTFGMLWQMRERFSDRIRFALYGLFSPKFDDFKFLALPKPLLFLYPAVRLFRLITKYFRR
jgi:hypothetical protein